MLEQQEIMENLLDAGCNEQEIRRIMDCLQNGNENDMKKLIAQCRKKQLARLHDSQKCIDRLDFLCYRIEKDVAKGTV